MPIETLDDLERELSEALTKIKETERISINSLKRTELETFNKEFKQAKNDIAILLTGKPRQAAAQAEATPEEDSPKAKGGAFAEAVVDEEAGAAEAESPTATALRTFLETLSDLRTFANSPEAQTLLETHTGDAKLDDIKRNASGINVTLVSYISSFGNALNPPTVTLPPQQKPEGRPPLPALPVSQRKKAERDAAAEARHEREGTDPTYRIEDDPEARTRGNSLAGSLAPTAANSALNSLAASAKNTGPIGPEVQPAPFSQVELQKALRVLEASGFNKEHLGELIPAAAIEGADGGVNRTHSPIISSQTKDAGQASPKEGTPPKASPRGDDAEAMAANPPPKSAISPGGGGALG